MHVSIRSLWVNSLLLATFTLPYCVRLGTSSLWDANEAFYAETPREMLESGDYVAPRFNYEPRAQKPPLTYWLILATYRLFGINELSVRLPGAAAALGIIVFTFLIGRTLFNVRVALMASIMAATTVRIFALARKLPIDILLLFFLLGTAYFLIRAAQRETAVNWICACCFAALGFMTKGPIAWLIPSLSFGIWLCVTRRWALPTARPLLGGLVLLALVLPWYVLIYTRAGWVYIAPFFLSDNFGRFATETFGPSRGPLYYVPAYLGDFFPWSLLSVAAGVLLWKERAKLQPLRTLSFGLPLIWCVVVFVLFSCSRNKQEYYIASMYPMAAILTAGMIDRARRSAESRCVNHWNIAFASVAVLLLALSPVSLLVTETLLPNASAPLRFAAPAALLGISALLIRGIVKMNPALNFTYLAGGLWVTFLLFANYYIPALEPLRPVKDLCRAIETQASASDQVGYFRTTAPSMAFYLRRPIFEEFDPEAMARRFRSGDRVFCLLTEKEYNHFVGSKDLILYILDRRPRLVANLRTLLGQESWTEQELLLVSNRPFEEGAAEGRRTP